MTPQEKADYFMIVFNNDILSCIRVCNHLLKVEELSQEKEFYTKVKSILENCQRTYLT